MTKSHLYTYKSQDMRTTPTEAITLRLCRGVKSAEDSTKKDYSFQVDIGDFVFYFHAESNEQKEKWIGVISKVLLPIDLNTQQMINPNILNYDNDEEDDDDETSSSDD